MIKEVKSNMRVAKKRNAGGCISEIAFNNDNVESDCIEYAKKFDIIRHLLKLKFTKEINHINGS